MYCVQLLFLADNFRNLKKNTECVYKIQKNKTNNYKKYNNNNYIIINIREINIEKLPAVIPYNIYINETHACMYRDCLSDAPPDSDSSRINVSSVDVPTQSLIAYIHLTRIAFGQSQPENFSVEFSLNVILWS